jgi:hypothetical protein
MISLWPRRRRHRALIAAALAVVVAATVPAVASAVTAPPATPGTRPATPSLRAAAAAPAPSGGLNLAVNERGRISRSISAVASSNASGSVLTVAKPAGATVRKAYIATATTGFTNTPLSQPLQIDSAAFPLGDATANGISSFNYFADVTGLVKPKIDAAAAGAVGLTVTEPEPDLTDGEIVVVVFDDPSVSVDRTVSILFGALQPSGDTYGIQLARPISLADPGTQLEMSLGISYSFQANGTQQFSTVDVNGSRLTSAAGGEDDGYSANGGLITVGGNGDSPANPADPQATPAGPRSDDELYDLRPFVRDGDSTITVNTTNPSRDDNVFLATFTMNPPVTGIVTSGGDKFVVVALGDSYQSGEGAGFSVRPASAYRDVFEKGTYSDGTDDRRKGCHRALQDYTTLNRNAYKPGATVDLTDLTCSGALITGGDKKKAVTGPVGRPVESDSQLQQALDVLAGKGISPADVDLVTVGMGGNDAGFANTVKNCLAMSILNEIARRKLGSKAQWLVDQVGCEYLDGVANADRLNATGSALPKAEADAGAKILARFPGAQVVQLDYPDSLPARNSPEYCGGLRRSDVDYARDRARRIDGAVAKGRDLLGSASWHVSSTRTTFGDNALCPGNPAQQLTNGVPKENFDALVTSLINTPSVLAGKLAAAQMAIADAGACLAKAQNPPFLVCRDLPAKLAAARARVLEIGQYLASIPDALQGGLASRPGATDDTPDLAFDRGFNLFHPNPAGIRVLACDAVSTYQNRATSGCLTAPSSPRDTVNSRIVNIAPVVTAVKKVVTVVLRGFRPSSPVHLRLFSEPIDLGTLTADADGTVTTAVTVPELNAGVHALQADGEGAGGVQVTKQVLLDVAGRPSGEYATYLCCFTPAATDVAPDAPREQVVVTVGGLELGTYTPDEDGRVLVKIPSVDRLTDPSALVISGRSTLTGKVVTKSVSPIPTTPALWATGAADTALSVTGSGFTADGRVHSEGGAQLTGARLSATGGTEYGSRLVTVGAGQTFTPAPVRVAAGQGAPAGAPITDYRPGGPVATSGVAYRAIPASACRGGTWSPAAGEQLTGVVYVPCGVQLSGVAAATVAAEGPVRVVGSGVRVGPATPGAPAIVTGATGTDAVTVTGTAVAVSGAVRAPVGAVRITGSNAVLECGIVADTIAVTGSGAAARMTARCLAA